MWAYNGKFASVVSFDDDFGWMFEVGCYLVRPD